MKYQLVLQWPDASIFDFNTVAEIESLLIDALPSSHQVDGHDFGVGEINIFIHTDDPSTAFQEVKNILAGRKYWAEIRVAYREFSSSDFLAIWPKNIPEFSVR